MLAKELHLGPIEIRQVLKSWIGDKFHLKNNDVLIDELGFFNKDPKSTIDSSFRADLALANGRLVGFEIKSEKDTLKRWETQMIAYSNVFDEVWLCVHGKHLAEALNITQKHIGILLIDDYQSLAVVRFAQKNNKNNIYDLSGLLWRDELNEFARNNGVKIKSRATKNEAREIIANELSLDVVRDFVLQKLKLRKGYQGLTSSISSG